MKKILLFVVMISFALRTFGQSSFTIENNKSPWSDTVSQCRDTTLYIILHTVEGLCPGCLVNMHQNLHTQLLITRDGRVTRLSEEDRLINHAGYSLWDGDTALWRISVGIEFEGWHNQPLTEAQYYIGMILIDSLQRRYRVDDEHVLPHSMVACTEDYCFRGRKKGCGQQFADPCVRLELGLRPLPRGWHDPDEREGRIKWPTNKVAQVLKRNLYVEGKKCAELLSRDTIQKIPSNVYVIQISSKENFLNMVKKSYEPSLSLPKQKGSTSRNKYSSR